MAVKFTPTGDTGQYWAQSIGSGLEAIANHKMQQLQKQQFKNQFKNIGVNEQGAELLSAFQNQPELLKPLLENIGMFMNQSQTGAQGSPMEQQSWQPNAFTGGGQQTPGLEQYQNGLPGGQELGQAISQLGRQPGNATVGQPSQQTNLGNAFKSAATKRAEQQAKIAEDTLALKRDKAQRDIERYEDTKQEKEIGHQEKLKTFLHEEAKTSHDARDLKRLAEGMLANIKKNAKKWPNALQANAPKGLQPAIIRDKDVRTYMRDAENIVSKIGSMQTGVVGRYKLEQIGRGKIDINQPIQTQIEGLEQLIDTANRIEDRGKYKISLKDKKGNYPTKLEDELSNWELAQDNPLEYPQYFKNNDKYIDDNGAKYVLRNGEWEPA